MKDVPISFILNIIIFVILTLIELAFIHQLFPKVEGKDVIYVLLFLNMIIMAITNKIFSRKR